MPLMQHYQKMTAFNSLSQGFEQCVDTGGLAVKEIFFYFKRLIKSYIITKSCIM